MRRRSGARSLRRRIGAECGGPMTVRVTVRRRPGLLRAGATVGALAAAGRGLGYARNVAVAAALGAGPAADAFFVAFRVGGGPCAGCSAGAGWGRRSSRCSRAGWRPAARNGRGPSRARRCRSRRRGLALLTALLELAAPWLVQALAPGFGGGGRGRGGAARAHGAAGARHAALRPVRGPGAAGGRDAERARALRGGGGAAGAVQRRRHRRRCRCWARGWRRRRTRSPGAWRRPGRSSSPGSGSPAAGPASCRGPRGRARPAGCAGCLRRAGPATAGVGADQAVMLVDLALALAAGRGRGLVAALCRAGGAAAALGGRTGRRHGAAAPSRAAPGRRGGMRRSAMRRPHARSRRCCSWGCPRPPRWR